jgi:YVTN family beta-propeller protein
MLSDRAVAVVIQTINPRRSHVPVPTWRTRFAFIIVLGLLCGPVGPAHATYRLLKKVALGGDERWDLLTLDAEGRRLYVARTNRVMVIDADSCTLIAEIPNTPGVHGIAIAHDQRRGFTTNGADTSATIFDLGSFAQIGRVVTGIRPDAVAFDPASGRVFTMNVGSRDATVIDAALGKVVGTVPLGGRPEFAVSDARGHLFVNLEDSSAVQVVDTRTLAPGPRWPLSPGTEPTGLAIDRERHRLFAVCADSLMIVMDSDNGRVIASLPIGRGVDAAAFDPATRRAYSSNGVGSLTVIQEESADSFRVVENVMTQPGARTMALDEKSHRVFLVTANFGPPPAATPEHPHPRGPILPGSFVLLVYGEQ